MSYDPQASVDLFHSKHGILGAVLLLAWDSVDPFRICYGCNPDEYVGYPERSIEFAGQVPLRQWLDTSFVVQAIRAGFHKSQLQEGLATDEHIKAIANTVIECIKELGFPESLLDSRLVWKDNQRAARQALTRILGHYPLEY